MNDTYNSLNYIIKRELSTPELKKLVDDLQLVIYARENTPF